jgi:hypothetical protein
MFVGKLTTSHAVDARYRRICSSLNLPPHGARLAAGAGESWTDA